MPSEDLSGPEIAKRGEAIYDEVIRPCIQPQDRGKHLVLDIISGEYEIADDDVTATQRMLARRPEGVLYGLRIGHAAAYRLGGLSRASANA